MSKRVLIIDDEVEILFIVQRIFEDLAGWETITSSSGSEGLQKAKTELLDAIVLDVSMPNMDGLQVVQELQTNLQTQSIPVVLLTANTTPSDRQKFSEMPVAGVITKPFDPATVWQQVADILGWNSRISY